MDFILANRSQANYIILVYLKKVVCCLQNTSHEITGKHHLNFWIQCSTWKHLKEWNSSYTRFTISLIRKCRILSTSVPCSDCKLRIDRQRSIQVRNFSIISYPSSKFFFTSIIMHWIRRRYPLSTAAIWNKKKNTAQP